MAPRLLHETQATQRRLLKAGAVVARAVEASLGPVARTVLYQTNAGGVAAAASGYDIAQTYNAACPVGQVAVRSLRNLGWEISDRWGDGTATAISLAAAQLAQLMRLKATGVTRPGQLLLDFAAETCVRLDSTAERRVLGPQTYAEIVQTACGENRDLANLLVEAATATGPQGYLEVQAAPDSAYRLELSAAQEFDLVTTSHAAQNPDLTPEPLCLEAASVVVFDGEIENFATIGPMLAVFARLKRPVLFAARRIARPAMTELLRFAKAYDAPIAAVQMAGQGLWTSLALGDLAAVTGATVFGDAAGYQLDAVRPALVGHAAKLHLDALSLRVEGGRADAPLLQLRLGMIREDIRSARYLSLDLERHEKRLARLTAGIARIHIGAGPEQSRDIARAKQAIGAIRAVKASSGMIVSGGARRLAEIAADSTHPFATSLAAPWQAIIRNIGLDTIYGEARTVTRPPLSLAGHVAPVDPANLICDLVRRAAATAALLGDIELAVTEAR